MCKVSGRGMGVSNQFSSVVPLSFRLPKLNPASRRLTERRRLSNFCAQRQRALPRMKNSGIFIAATGGVESRTRWQRVKKLWILTFHQKPGADKARRGRISFTDLRVRSNAVADGFLMKPFGLRSFGICALSLLGHRSLRICSLVASRSNPKTLSAAVSIVF
jgi:hypothetical protein